MVPVDSPSSVYSQSTDGGSPWCSPRSAHQQQWEQLTRLTSRNSHEFARLRAELDELNNRLSAVVEMDSPLRARLDKVNARTEEVGVQLAIRVRALDNPSASLQPSDYPPRTSSLPTGVLYAPAAGPPAAGTGRVLRIAREQGVRMLRTSDTSSVSPVSYRLPSQTRQPTIPPSLANE